MPKNDLFDITTGEISIVDAAANGTVFSLTKNKDDSKVAEEKTNNTNLADRVQGLTALLAKALTPADGEPAKADASTSEPAPATSDAAPAASDASAADVAGRIDRLEKSFGDFLAKFEASMAPAAPAASDVQKSEPVAPAVDPVAIAKAVMAEIAAEQERVNKAAKVAENSDQISKALASLTEQVEAIVKARNPSTVVVGDDQGEGNVKKSGSIWNGSIYPR